MRGAWKTAIVVLALGLGGATANAQPAGTPAGAPITVTVALSNFAFTPELLRLQANVPVRLHLVNQASGGHDFSAPGFFAASVYPVGEPVPSRGEVELAGGESVDILLTPRTPGRYALTCTHFLHSLFGMHGTIEVVP